MKFASLTSSYLGMNWKPDLEEGAAVGRGGRRRETRRRGDAETRGGGAIGRV